MRRQSTTIEDLISENIKEILADPEAIAKIEKRIDERTAKRNTQTSKRA